MTAPTKADDLPVRSVVLLSTQMVSAGMYPRPATELEVFWRIHLIKRSKNFCLPLTKWAFHAKIY